jgi:hypothetical protein
MDNRQALNEQLDGLFEAGGWWLNVVFPAMQSVGGMIALEAVTKGSLLLFWTFLAVTLGSVCGTFALVRKDIRKLEGVAPSSPDQPTTSRYIRNRTTGRLAMPIVAWIFSLCFWAIASF